MKQIIDGLVYDTDTAECIASGRMWTGDRNTIYRTPKGRWFIKQEKALCSIAESSVTLIPVDESTVKKWLLRWNEVDALEKYFDMKFESA